MAVKCGLLVNVIEEADTIPTIDKTVSPAQVKFNYFCKGGVVVLLLDPGSHVVHSRDEILLCTLVEC